MRLKFLSLGMLMLTSPCSAYGSDITLSTCALGRRNPQHSIPACTSIINNSKDISQKAIAYYNRGIALAKINDPSHAIDDLNNAIRLNARWGYVFEDRAEINSVLGNYKEAISDFTIAINKDPKHAFRYQGRGRAYQGEGNLESAQKDLDTAISIDPRDFRFFDRGVVYMARHEYEKAIADFDETVRRNPNFAVAYANRGLSFLALGQTDRALTEADRAVEIDPQDPSNYTNRALVLERTGNLVKSLSDIEISLARRPDDHDTLIARDRIKTALAAAILPSVQSQPLNTTTQRTFEPNQNPTSAPMSSLRRVALVIGNSDYSHVGLLPNPTYDAQGIAQVFEHEHFDVVELKTDLSLSALRHTLGDFEIEARNADIAVIYFSGHGIESGGKNFLIPIDAKLERDIDIEDETVPLERVLKAVAGAKQLKLVILDACRNDPFKASMQNINASRSVDRGLARIEPDGDTLVAYSAAVGTVAQDGERGHHSPFTSALINDLAIPNLDIRFALGKVRDDVSSVTKGIQVPFIYGSLGGSTVTLFRK